MTKNQTNSVGKGRGGRRAGAGRPPGAATAKTRAIADAAARTGQTPLEVMLAVMKAYTDRAKRSRKVEEKLRMMDGAAAVAKDAAPYMHPRLAAVEHSGKDGAPLPQPVTQVMPVFNVTLTTPKK